VLNVREYERITRSQYYGRSVFFQDFVDFLLVLIEYGVTSERLHVCATIKLSMDKLKEVKIERIKKLIPVIRICLLIVLSKKRNDGESSGA
jgi:hypothetical protein